MAEAVEYLISQGHDSRAVWDYTPRQIAAYVFFASRRQSREDSSTLAIGALAARGESSAVKQQIEKWSRV